jgi:hypothetical protein
MNSSKYDLFNAGVFVDTMTERGRIQDLIKSIRPVAGGPELRRIGSNFDGGYLVPDDLAGIACCLSPGVDLNASFESDLLENFGIGSHLIDASVSAPPTSYTPLSFYKRFLGPETEGDLVTLSDWIGFTGNRHESELLLQMDIEGAEYLTVCSTDVALFRQFRIIVIEIHHVEDWGHSRFFSLVESFFKKLCTFHHVVHNHPNNCCGVVNLGGVLAPRVFELTLLRKDRFSPNGYQTNFPHPLDSPNISDRPDLTLPPNWFR